MVFRSATRSIPNFDREIKDCIANGDAEAVEAEAVVVAEETAVVKAVADADSSSRMEWATQIGSRCRTRCSLSTAPHSLPFKAPNSNKDTAVAAGADVEAEAEAEASDSVHQFNSSSSSSSTQPVSLMEAFRQGCQHPSGKTGSKAHRAARPPSL